MRRKFCMCFFMNYDIITSVLQSDTLQTALILTLSTLQSTAVLWWILKWRCNYKYCVLGLRINHSKQTLSCYIYEGNRQLRLNDNQIHETFSLPCYLIFCCTSTGHHFLYKIVSLKRFWEHSIWKNNKEKQKKYQIANKQQTGKGCESMSLKQSTYKCLNMFLNM